MSKNDLHGSISFDLIKYTSKLDKAAKDRERWLKVLENREKLTIDRLTEMRMKTDSTIQREKEKKKRYDEEQDYRVIIVLNILIGRNENTQRVEI